MAKTLETAVHLGRHLAIHIIKPVQRILPGLTSLRDMHVFVCDQFRDGKAVMKLHHAYLFTRVGNPRFFVGLGAALVRSHEMVAVPVIERDFFTTAKR